MSALDEFIQQAINPKINYTKREEKLNLLKSNKVNPKVERYLLKKLKNLTIDAFGSFPDSVIELSKYGKLLGWCWETTSAAIGFLNDYDYISRGIITIDEYEDYEHAWIVFNFQDKEYVFDPCLTLLCDKEIYDKIFEVKLNGKVYAKDVKNYLINELNTSKDIDNNDLIDGMIDGAWSKKNINSFMREKANKIDIIGDEDINSPMYRNNVSYKVKIKNDKIKKLKVDYHLGF